MIYMAFREAISKKTTLLRPPLDLLSLKNNLSSTLASSIHHRTTSIYQR